MTTITVEAKREPKQEGWSWGVKTSDGTWLGASDAHASKLEIGGTYDVDIVVKEKGGKIYRDISRVNGRTGEVHRFNPVPHVPSTQGPKVDQTPERIFVCGLLNGLIGHMYERNHGDLNSESLADLVRVFRETYANTFGKV